MATIDIRQGRIVSRWKSADGVVPGNLVPCGNTVLSQTVTGVWQFGSRAADER